jgi:hypothetical protein
VLQNIGVVELEGETIQTLCFSNVRALDAVRTLDTLEGHLEITATSSRMMGRVIVMGFASGRLVSPQFRFLPDVIASAGLVFSNSSAKPINLPSYPDPHPVRRLEHRSAYFTRSYPYSAMTSRCAKSTKLGRGAPVSHIQILFSASYISQKTCH